MTGGKKCNQNFCVGFFFAYQSHSQFRPVTFHIPCIASVTQQQLSHASFAHVYRLFYLPTEIRGCGYCSRQLMGQVMHCLRWRSLRNRNPLSNRGYNERLCFEGSIFKISQTRNIWPFFLREGQNLKGWLLIKNSSVMTVWTASSRINKSRK